MLTLIINRFVASSYKYSIELNMHEDITIWKTEILSYNKDVNEIININTIKLKDIDRLITNSVDSKFAILNIYNPILDYKDLKEYWKIRIKYGKKPITLIEYGKRLFDN